MTRRRATGEFTADVVHLIIDRDQGSCVGCGKHVISRSRGKAWSIHHRAPRGMGGTSLPWVGQAANGVVLCGSGTTGCHGYIERNRDIGRRMGLLISRNGVAVATDVPLDHALHGFVLLDNDGGFTPVTKEQEGGQTTWA